MNFALIIIVFAACTSGTMAFIFQQTTMMPQQIATNSPPGSMLCPQGSSNCANFMQCMNSALGTSVNFTPGSQFNLPDMTTIFGALTTCMKQTGVQNFENAINQYISQFLPSITG